MLWIASLLVTIGSGELAKPEWDLEWLITLPVRSDTLLWARLAERSIVNPSGVLALIPACIAIAWFSGLRWSAPLIGVLAAWPLLLLAALVRTLIDTGLRLRMRAAQLRNLHAVISVLSIITMYLAVSIGLKGKSDFMLRIAASMPDWLLYTPMGLTVRAINERTFADAGLLHARVARRGRRDRLARACDCCGTSSQRSRVRRRPRCRARRRPAGRAESAADAQAAGTKRPRDT